MASELRWILVAICVPLLIAIWWWGSRRSRQAPGNAELRESTLAQGAHGSALAAAAPQGGAGPMAGMNALAAAPAASAAAGQPAASRDWAVSPLEPLNIRTAEFEPVDVEPLRMSSQPDAAPGSLDPADEIMTMPLPDRSPPPLAPKPVPARAAVTPAATRTPAEPPAPVPAAADAAATGSHPEGPNVSQTQRIVTIRVGAIGEARWSGSALLAALERHGMAFGRYQVFHRRHSDGRTLFCAASLVEPGTFELDAMPQQEFRGVTLFAVLPGPIEPLQTLNELILTAGQLADSLHGVVQDSRGRPLTQKQAEAIREDVAQFQAMLNL